MKYNNYPLNADPRPQRYKDKDNPYTIYTIEKDTDHPKYFVEFNDGEGGHQCVEVTKKVFWTFDNYELADVSYKNECNRHLVKTNLTDVEIHLRSADSTEPDDEYAWSEQDIYEQSRKIIIKWNETKAYH